jgi:hypothetical protein
MKISSFRSIATPITAVICFTVFNVDCSSAAGLRKVPIGESSSTKQTIVKPDITTAIIPRLHARDLLGLYLKKEEDEEDVGDNYAYISSDGNMHIIIHNDIDQFVKSYGVNGFPAAEEGSKSIHITCNIDGRGCFMDINSAQSGDDDRDENNEQRS